MTLQSKINILLYSKEHFGKCIKFMEQKEQISINTPTS